MGWLREPAVLLRTGQGAAPAVQEVAGLSPQPRGQCRISFPFQRQSNASQTLCDIIRLGREQGGQPQEAPEPDPLLTVLES